MSNQISTSRFYIILWDDVIKNGNVNNLGIIDSTPLHTLIERVDDKMQEYYKHFNCLFNYAYFSNDVIKSDPYLFKITDDIDLNDVVYQYMSNHNTLLYSVYEYIIYEMKKRKKTCLSKSSISGENGVHAWARNYKYEHFDDISIIIKFISLYDLDEKDKFNNDCKYYLSQMEEWNLIENKLRYLEAIRYNALASEEDLNDDAREALYSIQPINLCIDDALREIIDMEGDEEDPIYEAWYIFNENYLFKYCHIYLKDQNKLEILKIYLSSKHNFTKEVETMIKFIINE